LCLRLYSFPLEAISVKPQFIKSIKAVACVTLLATSVSLTPAYAADPNPSNWDAVVKQAKGQTVYWNAWGGSQNINAYIAWAGGMLKDRYGVTVEHVKLDDTAKAVATVVAEKTAGKDEGGRIDLIWINGENFAAMKRQNLLFSPGWADKLPNWKFVDVENKPTRSEERRVGKECRSRWSPYH